jgi:glutamine synthetase
MIDKIKSQFAEKGIKYVFCSFIELTGAPKAKLVPVSHMEEFAQDGTGFAGFACGEVGQSPYDPDISSIPDFRSLAILPWRQNIAWVTRNLYVDGRWWPLCLRTVLMRQLDQADKQGYTVNIGVEPEFMVLNKNAGTGEFAPWDQLDTLPNPCYDLRTLHRNLDIMTTLL